MQIENKLAVLILCGGKGTRLGTKFKNTNKSLIKVNGKTLISTNINYLFKQTARRPRFVTTFFIDICIYTYIKY